MQENGETMEVSGDDIFKLPDGKLTTMYHYMNNINIKNENKITKAETTEEVNL